MPDDSQPQYFSAEEREAAILKLLPLTRARARVAARKIHPGNDTLYCDLAGAAQYGLVAAAARFDKARGTPFFVYADGMIKNAMRQYLADNNDYMSPYIRTLFNVAMKKVGGTLTPDNLEQAITETPMRESTRAFLKHAARRRLQGSEALHIPLDGTELHHSSDLPPPDHAVHRRELRQMLGQALRSLSERQRAVLFRTVIAEEPETQDAVAAEWGVTPGRVSQLRKKALSNLRRAITAQPLAEAAHG